VGSLERGETGSVWGVVFAVTERDLDRLDRFEGVKAKPPSYRRSPIEVLDKSRRLYPVETHLAVPADGPSRHYAPSQGYIRLYIRGAEHFGLPEDYVRSLRAIETNGEEL
jgi:AIG2-like family